MSEMPHVSYVKTTACGAVGERHYCLLKGTKNETIIIIKRY